MKHPRLTVIMPVYNVERYIRECLDSLVAQKEPDVEILIVDDGSPDRSGEICDEYAARDPRLKVFHRSNGGVSSARNFALDRASGEIVTFVDSDDYVSPDYCSRIIAEMEGCDLLCFQAEWVSPSDERTCYPLRSEVVAQSAPMAATVIALREGHPGVNLLGYPWNKAFRRDILERHGIRFDSALKFREDEVFVLDYLHHVEVLKCIDASLYFYRVLNSGLSSAVVSARELHDLYVALDGVRGSRIDVGPMADSLTYDIMGTLFAEALCRYKEGAEWVSVMRGMCRYHDLHRPGDVAGRRNEKLAVKVRNRYFWRLLLTAAQLKG